MPSDRFEQRIVVAAVFVAAMFMSGLDVTAVNVALPSIAEDFSVDTAAVEWVIVGYLLSLAVWIPASGWLGDRVGTRRIFLTALAVFTLASALCGLATSLPQLVAFRVLQGVGGGMLTPVGTAMLFRTFPPEQRARASKVLLVPAVAAPALGPVLGGWLTDTFSWRWIFFVNVPIGVTTFAFGLLFLHEHREPPAGRFDLWGFVLGGAGLVLVLYALNEGPREGWGSPKVLCTGLGGVVLLAAFVTVELRRTHPMLQLRLLGDRLFRSTTVVGILSIAPFLAVSFAVPLFLQTVRGLSAFESGLTTFPEAIGVMVSSQFVARLYPRIGPRRLIAGGMVPMAASMAALCTMGVDTDLWVVRGLMFSVGVGMAYSLMPLQAASFATISRADTGHASAIFSTQRQVAGACGVAAMATVLSSLLPDAGARDVVDLQVRAFHVGFACAAGLALLAAVSALFVRDGDAANTMAPGARVRSSRDLAPATT